MMQHPSPHSKEMHYSDKTPDETRTQLTIGSRSNHASNRTEKLGLNPCVWLQVEWKAVCLLGSKRFQPCNQVRPP